MKESTRNYLYITMLIVTLFSLIFSFSAWHIARYAAIPVYNQQQIAEQQLQEQQLLKDQIVYITKHGEKYHKKTCRYLNNSIITTLLYDAKINGYQPCSECMGG